MSIPVSSLHLNPSSHSLAFQDPNIFPTFKSNHYIHHGGGY